MVSVAVLIFVHSRRLVTLANRFQSLCDSIFASSNVSFCMLTDALAAGFPALCCGSDFLPDRGTWMV